MYCTCMSFREVRAGPCSWSITQYRQFWHDSLQSGWALEFPSIETAPYIRNFLVWPLKKSTESKKIQAGFSSRRLRSFIVGISVLQCLVVQPVKWVAPSGEYQASRPDVLRPSTADSNMSTSMSCLPFAKSEKLTYEWPPLNWMTSDEQATNNRLKRGPLGMKE